MTSDGADLRFSQITRAVYMDTRLSHAQRTVLGYLGTYPHPERGCWPGLETIAAHLGMTASVVSKHLRGLQGLGYLEIVKRGAPGQYRADRHPNLYRIITGVIQCNPSGATGVIQCAERVSLSDNKDIGLSKKEDIEKTPRNSARRVEPPSDDDAEEEIAISDEGWFELFWSAIPSRGTHPNPKKPARQKFMAALKRGVDPQAIVEAAGLWKMHVHQTEIEAQYVPQALTWLNQERWKEFDEAAIEAEDAKLSTQRPRKTDGRGRGIVAALSGLRLPGEEAYEGIFDQYRREASQDRRGRGIVAAFSGLRFERDDDADDFIDVTPKKGETA